MRASDLDERKFPPEVSRYAPPHYRAPGGRMTIRPVLERLSRGEPRDDSNSGSAQPAPPSVEPIHVQEASPFPKFPLSMTGRLAAAVGVVVALTIVSVTLLKSRAEHPASSASADSRKTTETTNIADEPKIVHTVAVRPEIMTVGEAQASAIVPQLASSQPNASVVDRIEALDMKPAQSRIGPALALTAPLTMWALFPAAPESGPWNSTGASTNAGEVKDDDVKDAAPARTADVPPKAKAAKHVRRARRHRGWPSRTRSATARPQQLVPREQTQANTVQPTKRIPLQAALDAIFGNNDDSDGGGFGSAAQPPAGAAFQ